MVESTALEMRHRGNSIGGSNPSLSARALNKVFFLNILMHIAFIACRQILYQFIFFKEFFKGLSKDLQKPFKDHLKSL